MAKKLPVLDIEGPPLANREEWHVKVDGLVEQPHTFDLAELCSLEAVELTQPFICVEGWDTWVKWKGVKVSDLIRRCKPRPEAGYVTFYSYSEYTDSLSLQEALDSRTLLAYGLEGEALPLEHGGPVRLVVPFMLAYKSVKWVTRISFTEKQELGYWEVRGYPAEAGVPDEKRMQYDL